MTIEEAIRVFQYGAWWHDYADYRPETKKSDEYKDELLDAIDVAISALRAQQEAKSPCAACGYGGKHLDAPPCTSCPAYPKGAEKNEPLMMDALKRMVGEPVYLDGHGWVLVGEDNRGCEDEPPILVFVSSDMKFSVAQEMYKAYGEIAYRYPPKEAHNV